MATRKPSNPELAAAARNLNSAAHHIRRAVNRKLDEIAKTVAMELQKAKNTAMTKGGQAKRRFDALLKKTEARLKKVNGEARKSLHKAVAEAEKKLVTAKTAVTRSVAARKTATKPAGRRVVAKKVAAKRAPAKKATAKRSRRKAAA
jgi:flagellar biosynthesis/type III secretory pathway protein FliH